MRKQPNRVSKDRRNKNHVRTLVVQKRIPAKDFWAKIRKLLP